jgi:hypothetical protein
MNISQDYRYIEHRSQYLEHNGTLQKYEYISQDSECKSQDIHQKYIKKDYHIFSPISV